MLISTSLSITSILLLVIIQLSTLFNVVTTFSISSIRHNHHYQQQQQQQQQKLHDNKHIILNNNNRYTVRIPFSSSSSTSSSIFAVTAVNGDATSSSSISSKDNNNSNNNANNNNLRLNINQKARTVTSVCTSGTLCTISYEDDIAGAPFGSFVDYVLDDNGCPILLMNDMSMHTINIQNAMKYNKDNNEEGAMVTLFTQLGGGTSTSTSTVQTSAVSGSSSSNSNSNKNNPLQDVSRCSITGLLRKMNKDDTMMDSIRMKYSLTHSSYADQVMDSPKFTFYRLVPKKIYFVGGYGVLAKWVNPIDYQSATPDILAKYASSITEKLNREHITDLYYVGQYLLNITETIDSIKITNVDRLGIDVRVTYVTTTRRTNKQTDEYRIGFRIPVISIEDAKSEILKIFQDSWEYGNGYTWSTTNTNTNTDTDTVLHSGSSNNNNDDTESMIPVMKIAADSLE